jgi:transcription elongation factor Elf1
MHYLKRLYESGLFLRRGENTSVPKYEHPKQYKTIKDLRVLTCPSCRGRMLADTIMVGQTEQAAFTCEVCKYTMSV